MSQQEPSAQQRAEQAAEAAAAARREAARHAADRRAEQSARRRGTPARRPPALRRPGPAPPSPRVQSSGADDGPARSETSPRVESGEVAEGQVAEGQVAEGQVAEGQVAEGQVEKGRVAEVEAPVTPHKSVGAHAKAPELDDAGNGADEARADTDELKASVSSQDLQGSSPAPATAKVDEGDIPPLPLPPQVVRTPSAFRPQTTTLRLPQPPRRRSESSFPPADAAAVEASTHAVAVTGTTIDIDVRGSLADEVPQSSPDPAPDDATLRLPAPPRDAATSPTAVVGPSVAEEPADDGTWHDDAVADTGADQRDLAPAEIGNDVESDEPTALDPDDNDVDELSSAEITVDVVDLAEPDAVDLAEPDADRADADRAGADPDATTVLEPVTGNPADPTVDLPSLRPGAAQSDLIGPEPAARLEADRPWVRQYPPGVPETYRYPLVPLTRLLDDAAQDFPDATAMSFLGTQITYRQMAEQVDRLAAALTDLELTLGDRVAVVLPWTPQLALTLHACWRLGLDAVVLDCDEAPESIAEAIRTTEPNAVVLLDTLYNGLVQFREQLGSVRHVIATGLLDALPAIRARMQAVRLKVPSVNLPQADGVLHFRSVMEGASPTATQQEFDVEQTAAVTIVVGGEQASSTHHEVLAGAFQTRLWIPDVKAGREVVMVAGSPTDSYGVTAGMGLAMLAAATLVLPDPRPGGLARAIDTERPTILATTMDQIRTMLAPASKRRDLSSIRVTLARGVHIDPVVTKAAESRTAGRFRMAYSGIGVAGLAVAEPVYGEGRGGPNGLPVCDVIVEVAGAEGPHDHGELLVSGPQVSGGRRPLGLVGYVDPTGFVSVVGASETVIVHRDGASDPGMMRTALRRHAAIVEANLRVTEGAGQTILHADILTTDASLTSDQLIRILAEHAPTQSPPASWTIEVAVAAEPEREDPVDGDDESDGTQNVSEESDDGGTRSGPAVQEGRATAE